MSQSSNNSQAGDSIILEEEIDPKYVPTEKEVLEYAKWLGMDLNKDKDLFWIAKEGLKAPLPNDWKPCKTTDTEEIYYFNFATGASTWDHPCDEYYRSLYEENKKKKTSDADRKQVEKKKQKDKEFVGMQRKTGGDRIHDNRQNKDPAMDLLGKRRRTEAEAEKAGYVRLIDEKLQQLVGGQKLLLESELTRADLLEFLKTEGFIREVKGVVEVKVQTMSGSSFGVMLEFGGTVADLKSEIQEAQGLALYQQQLFMLGEGAEGGSEAQEPLKDDQEISSSCTVMLCVQAEEEWSWDASSPLLERNMFELRGPNNSVAATIVEDCSNCMMAGPVMEVGTGKHTISMQLEGEGYCGVVSDGAACDEYHAYKESTLGWFMAIGSGSLFGNGKFGDDNAGALKPWDVLTMQADTDAGTLKFWVNGKPHGPGYTSGVQGPLRWATASQWPTALYFRGSTAKIVPTPALQLRIPGAEVSNADAARFVIQAGLSVSGS